MRAAAKRATSQSQSRSLLQVQRLRQFSCSYVNAGRGRRKFLAEWWLFFGKAIVNNWLCIACFLTLFLSGIYVIAERNYGAIGWPLRATILGR
jgi:hypothetical protein